MTSAFTLLAMFLRALGFGLVLVCADQHHGLWLMPFVRPLSDEFLRWMPHLDVQVWPVVGIVLPDLDRKLGNLRRRFRASNARR